MPHKCTNCSNVIEDGSDYLLTGCPDCGEENSSWRYLHSNPSDESKTNEDDIQKEARTEFVDDTDLPSSSAAEALQPSDGILSDETDGSNFDKSPQSIEDVEEVRKRLNKQYDGIEIVRKGRYEINLTKLYRGTEYVITLGDDGAYKVKKSGNI